ncbi:MAG: hypothetical protein JNL19_10320 [Burkholderiales bacterium]|nr:hypothetical protein [Burkholderiales bacterium]
MTHWHSRFGSRFLVSAAGALALSLLAGCGGGSSSSSSSTTATTLSATPATFNAFGNTPNVIGITGGKGPFSVKSSNTAVIPVPATITGASFSITPNNVLADTAVTLTVSDSAGATSAVTVTVTPATIPSGRIAVTPASGSVCAPENNAAVTAATLCAGELGTAAVTLRDANGAVLSNRSVRFEALTIGATLSATKDNAFYSRIATVNTDSSGVASVFLKADVEATSESAFLRATDTVSGHRVDTWIMVLKQTNGASDLAIVPTTGGQFSYYSSECPYTVREYGVNGGTAPFTISLASGSTLSLGDGVTTAAPGAAVVLPAAGARFTVTNSASTTCTATASTVTVTDAKGATALATHNLTPGSNARPTATTDLTLSPPSITMVADTVATYCTSGTTRFTVSGGTAPYIATASIPQISTSIGSDGVTLTAAFTSDAKWKMLKGQTSSVLVLDAAGKVVTAILACS